MDFVTLVTLNIALNVDDSLITITYNFPENNDTAMDTTHL